MGNKEECKKLWGEIDKELEHALKDLQIDTNRDVLDLIENERCKNENWDQEILNELKKGLDKLQKKNKEFKELNEIKNQLSSAQQSGASNVAMASSLGPAAGIGAGLSLFPLLSRVTKFFK